MAAAANHPTPNCTVLLPSVPQPEAGNLVATIIAALLDAGVDRIVIAEPHGPEDPRVRCVPFRPDDTVPRWINAAQRSCETHRLWLHDPRIWLPFDRIVEAVRVVDAVAIRPFTGVFRCSPREAHGLLSGAIDAREPLDARGRLRHHALGKASMILHTEVFRALGGLNERFADANEAGLEFIRRLRHWFKDIAELPTPAFELAVTTAAAADRALRESLVSEFAADPCRYQEVGLQTSLPKDAERRTRVVNERSRAAAFRKSSDWQPRRDPVPLPGSLWAVTTYFNSEGFASKRANLEQFCAAMEAAKVPLLIVELVFPGQHPELETNHARQVLRVGSGDVLWQKERLLNLAVAHLPADCDKVAWLDADVLFANPQWVAATCDQLENYQVVQPFSHSVRLRRGETSIATDDLPLGNSEHEILHGIAYGMWAKGPTCLDRYLAHGHTGYAWAARRTVLERCGLYEHNILGNADLTIARAMFGGAAAIDPDRLSEKAAAHVAGWADRLHREVDRSVAHVDGVLFHLWHGDKRDRLYDQRLRVLVEHDFDPESDLAIGPDGAFVWASAKPELHAWCREYFARRREDGAR